MNYASGLRVGGMVMSSAGSNDQIRRISQVIFLAVIIFAALHLLQWSTRCGPFASGAYRDYCADLDRIRQARQVIINEATQARRQAATRTPYVDLRDAPEEIERFVPPGHGVVKNRANAREGPGMAFDVIETLERDRMVEIIEDSDGWVRVRLNLPGDAETFGWIWQDLLAR